MQKIVFVHRVSPTYNRVSIADLLVILVEDGLEPQLGWGPGANVHSVLEAQGVVIVGEEVADGGVIPADNDGVRLNLIWDTVHYVAKI